MVIYNLRIIYTNVYFKRIVKLLNQAERMDAENEIVKDPYAWPIIKGASGIRKARAKRGSSGKSGGIRIIYYYLVIEDSIYMLTAYSKNDQDNLTEADKKAFRNIVQSLKRR